MGALRATLAFGLLTLGGTLAGCAFDPPAVVPPRGGTVELDGGFVDDSGPPNDAGPDDAGPPVDAGFDASVEDLGPADSGVALDAGAPDTGVVPDAGFPDTGVVPDAGFPDSGVVPDAGLPPTPCDRSYARAVSFSNVRRLAPADATDMRSPWLSDDGLSFYVAARTPRTDAVNSFAYQVFWYRRSSTAVDFDLPTETNLDFVFGANTTEEFDLGYVPATGQFWFTLSMGLSLSLNSAELVSPAQGATFRDIVDEVDVFPDRSQDHRGPALTADGLLLVSARRAGVATWDLVERSRATTRSAWGPPSLLGTVNTTEHEIDPWVSPDGTLLLFASTRTPGTGGSAYDLYCAHRASRAQPWSAPTPFGGPQVNSTGGDERTPFLHPNGRLLFSRSTNGRPSEILQAEP